MKALMNDLESLILQIIDESPSKVTYQFLKGRVSTAATITSKKLKAAIANLVSSGTVCYTFHYGRSFIERSLEKPLLISKHVVLKPARCFFEAGGDHVVVSLEKGAAFGCGEHPTTRMAIQLIDHCLHEPYWMNYREALKALDIGTGSGILAIVAAKLGVSSVFGIDTDPCSIYEARENVNLNRLNHRINICGIPLDHIREQFDLVFANLRTPTLISICDDLHQFMKEKSVLVLSGMKEEEAESVWAAYRTKRFEIVKNCQEKGWSALCLMRG